MSPEEICMTCGGYGVENGERCEACAKRKQESEETTEELRRLLDSHRRTAYEK